MSESRVRRVLDTTDRRLDTVVDAGLRWIRGHRPPWWLVDAFFVAAAVGDAVLDISGATTFETSMSLLAAAALLLRRRLPVTAFALTLPGLFVGSAVVASVVALFTIGQRTERRWLMLLAAVVEFVGFGGFVGPPQTFEDVIVSIIYALIFALGPLSIGLLAQTRQRLTERLAERDTARAEERRQAAEVALSRERALLAREMHDVVSHQVTLIAVQAGGMQMAGRDEAERGFARTIRQLCVVTLQELREMVQVLRAAGGTDRQIAPQPVLADLDRLVAAAGLDTTTAVALPETLSQPVQRAVYRFVQEALTNVRKHAPGAAVHVSGAVVDGAVAVHVVNGPPASARLELPGSGLGLIGLSERASLLGGALVSGPTEDGGFALHLTLPVDHLPPTG
ncbi:sensor histidine kinase [Curtobacterium sp. VKM Ac-2922]|uniref:sensor histidine kinase n=1 Tax=Curtobacterium sp. VKM Ac-2922 TaxID=2929475 RepID=UPI001FB4CF09|nr:histidine kinase [Curtobacterium sp. VKM Ac-2922]MCJ1713991.1 histidine kinase [Curtobacterium sp. VKM Ac-2922]